MFISPKSCSNSIGPPTALFLRKLHVAPRTFSAADLSVYFSCLHPTHQWCMHVTYCLPNQQASREHGARTDVAPRTCSAADLSVYFSCLHPTHQWCMHVTYCLPNQQASREHGARTDTHVAFSTRKSPPETWTRPPVIEPRAMLPVKVESRMLTLLLPTTARLVMFPLLPARPAHRQQPHVH